MQTSKAISAPISQIFSSLQGEGPYLGERHLFVRFRDCNIHCTYCDEVGHPSEDLDISALMERVKKIDAEQGPHHMVSLTGGEPLFYPQYLEVLIPALKKEGFQIYLETNGMLDKPLEKMLHWMDVIAMDIKLSSVTHERDILAQHAAFLKVARQKNIFAKMVVSRELELSELEQALAMIQNVHPDLLVILQPVTQGDHVDYATHDIGFLEGIQRFCLKYIKNVRVVPRLHKLVGIL